MPERDLAQQLIAHDTSDAPGIRAAAEFVGGWLESAGVHVQEHSHRDLPILLADVGSQAPDAPSVILHGHLDVVPARAGQFEPRIDGDRLIGRGAYDMKGALAAMLLAVKDVAQQDAVAVKLVCVPDEESEEVENRSTDVLVADGLRADFAITGEPTEMHIGVEAKGVLALRVEVGGTAAHGSTPWLGDNAILKAYDTYRRIETLRFARESTEIFERPSINLARIGGGDAFNKVPDECWMDVDIRYLPTQDPDVIVRQIEALGEDVNVLRSLHRGPAFVPPTNPYVQALREAIGRGAEGEVLSVGRDGASDAIAFLEAGVPAVEFGPVGGGHHGPAEWVSLDSLQRYRQALGEFVKVLPHHLAASS
jgi:succinyl-diaminopimelate desuccinylase